MNKKSLKERINLQDEEINAAWKEIQELKRENEILKEENLNQTEEIKASWKENKKLKKENKTLEDIHNGDMKIVKMLKDKKNKKPSKVDIAKTELEDAIGSEKAKKELKEEENMLHFDDLDLNEKQIEEAKKLLK